MAYTPKSENLETRFSTPVSELDDHRDQPNSLPRIEGSALQHPGTRRGTAVSVASADHPNLMGVNELLRHGLTVRDFVEENAIADDGSVVDMPLERRGSAAVSPSGVRRNTFIRPRNPQVEKLSRSRASSSSSRSTSPPNSVDAFAIDHPRRGRAGTLTSQAASDTELPMQRAGSIGTHRRRPTFSDDRSANQDGDASSAHSSAEEDVCFPVPETSGKTFEIDFEELEEFVAESQTKTPIPAMTRKGSVSSRASKPRVFHDLRPHHAGSGGKDGQGEISGSDAMIEKMDLPEKHAEILGQAPPEREGSIRESPPMNRFTFFSSEMDDTIHAAELGGLLMPGETFRDLFSLRDNEGENGGGVWWLDIANTTEEELHAVCKAFGVHPLTREDIMMQEAREKVELFSRYYFVCFRSFYQMEKDSEDFLEPVSVYAVVLRQGILTFTFCQNPHASNVRKRIGRLRDYVSLSADWICYALIDDIVDSFGPIIRDVEYETDAIEDQVFTARAEDSRAILRSIGDCRKKVMTLLRLLGGKADVIKGFAKRCNEKFDVTPRGDVGLYLSDIQDHVVTMMSNLAHFEKMLSRSHSNYLAQISVDSLMQGNGINETLGKVTMLATVLVPLNLICGLFGMNVAVPWGHGDSLAPFFGILGIILLVIASFTIIARRMKLI